jgi:hypothetical protein
MGWYILWTLLYLEILIYGIVIGFSKTHTCNAIENVNLKIFGILKDPVR